MNEKQIGVITHYFGKVSVGAIRLDGPLNVGDTIHVKGAHDDFTQSIDSMQIEHDQVKSAGKGDVVGIRVAQKVHPNDRVFLVTE